MNNGRRWRLTYRALDRWRRLLAFLVPMAKREVWRTEWDGELWYGVRGRPGGLRLWAAIGLALGMLQDALDVRRGSDRDGWKRRTGGGDGMGTLLTDIRYSLRVLRKAPAFTAVVVFMLALGVGGTVTIFSVVNSLLLNPLPYPGADRLVMLWEGRRANDVDKDWFSGGHFTDIKTQTDAFDEITVAQGSSSTLTGQGSPIEVGWVRAPSAYLRLLGAGVTTGRLLDEEDDRADATSVALLTYGLWERAFGSDPDVVGRSLTLDGEDVEIVGVLSADFLLNSEVMPTTRGEGPLDVVLSFPLTADILSDRQAEGYNIVGRLAPGVTLEQAQAQLDRVAENIQRLHESDPRSGFFIRAVPLLDEVVGSVSRALTVLLVSVGGVLLIVCVNVANLLLARSASRDRELGVRAAMGADRGRLFRQLLTENAVLAALGGALGVGLAAAGLRLVRQVGAVSLPRVSEIGIDGRVLLFSLAITLATCLVFGLLATVRTARVDVANTLKPGGRSTTVHGSFWSRLNLSNALVVAEIALALVLLVGGGLLFRSFMALEAVDPGFRTEGRLTFLTRLDGDAYADRPSRVAFYNALLGKLGALPGVESAGAASHVPFDTGISWGPIDVDAYVPPQGADHQIITDWRITTPDYFRTMEIPVVRGRPFDAHDVADAPPVAIIDETFADTYFPDQDPLGMQLVDFFDTKITIVGVVGAVSRETLTRVSRVTTYRPQDQWGARRMYVALATEGDPTALVAPATRAVAELDDQVAVVDVRTMESRVEASLAERRFSMALLQVLGLVALVLAVVGIYGLISYRVSSGARELGLRIALGAEPRTILHLVLGHGLGLAVTGVASGLLVALTLTGYMRSMLFGVDAVDPWTYASVASTLGLTALLACYIPARRATRVDPLDAIGRE